MALLRTRKFRWFLRAAANRGKGRRAQFAQQGGAGEIYSSVLPTMSQRNWREHAPLGVGLVGVVLLLSIAGLVNHSKYPNRGNGDAQHSEDALKSAKDALAPVVGRQESPPSNPEADRKEWREEQDLKAQMGASILGQICRVCGNRERRRNTARGLVRKTDLGRDQSRLGRGREKFQRCGSDGSGDGRP
jgi:hypothetical protein